MRMLGRYRLRAYLFDGRQWGWHRVDSDRQTKYRKLAEKQRWQRELPEELRPLPDDGDLDPGGDCHHGCNGDCEVSGSEKCNFTCHDPSIGQFWKDLNRRLEDPEFRKGYIRESLKLQALWAESENNEDPAGR